jgi:hypothetical protein
VDEKQTRDDDATEQLERPPVGANVDPSRPPPAAVRRPADRWSTVFTVFAAVALIALLLLGAAVVSSQQVAAPSASPSSLPSPSASPSTSPTPIPQTATPTEAQPSLTPVPTRTAPPLTPVPTILPSVPVSTPPLATRTP